MDYKTFMDDYKDMIGETVWICDYRFTDISQKPIRHVKPTEAIIVSNDDLPKNKTVYYSTIHFRPIGKKGTPLKQIISPYDNTGFRSFTGTSLNIFLRKEECVNHYVKQCEIVKKEIEKERKRANQRLDEIKEQINDTLISYDRNINE